MKAFIVVKPLTYFTAGVLTSTVTALDALRDQATFVAPSVPASDWPKVITPAISTFVEESLIRSSIPGLSMGVVHLDSSRSPVVETAAWGRQTEEGDGNDLSTKVWLYIFASERGAD